VRLLALFRRRTTAPLIVNVTVSGTPDPAVIGQQIQAVLRDYAGGQR
jgi:hypothetical protein